MCTIVVLSHLHIRVSCSGVNYCLMVQAEFCVYYLCVVWLSVLARSIVWTCHVLSAGT